MANKYCNSVAYAAVAQWAASTVYAAGAIVRQVSVGFGAQRCFRTALGGTSGTTEPVWSVSPNAVNYATDGTITDWTECTGQEAYQSPGAWSAPHGDVGSAFSYYSQGWTGAPASASGWAVGDFGQSTTSAQAGCPVIFKVTAVSAGRPTSVQFISLGSFSSNIFPGNVNATWTALTGAGVSFTQFYSGSNGGQHTADGDVLYLSSNHAETVAGAISPQVSGTLAAPTRVISVDESSSGHIPPTTADYKEGASLTTTGAFALSPTQQSKSTAACYWWGVTFNCGTGAVAVGITLSCGASGSVAKYERCNFKKLGTNALAGAITVGNSAALSKYELIDCTVQFGHISDTLIQQCRDLIIRDTTRSFLQGAILNTNLFTSTVGVMECVGVDFSALTSKALFGAGWSYRAFLRNCKYASGMTIPTPTNSSGEIVAVDTDSGATNYRTEKYNLYGTQTVETTIVRTGGASDGTTPISWKIVTTANAIWDFSFASLPIVIWNDTSGASKTVTVYGIWGGGAVPNNDDIWLEARYLGSSGAPQSSVINNTKANFLASNAPQSSDGSVWGGSTTAFKMSVSLTPQMKGPIEIVVRTGRPSATFYIDPLATVV